MSRILDRGVIWRKAGWLMNGYWKQEDEIPTVVMRRVKRRLLEDACKPSRGSSRGLWHQDAHMRRESRRVNVAARNRLYTYERGFLEVKRRRRGRHDEDDLFTKQSTKRCER